VEEITDARFPGVDAVVIEAFDKAQAEQDAFKRKEMLLHVWRRMLFVPAAMQVIAMEFKAKEGKKAADLLGEVVDRGDKALYREACADALLQLGGVWYSGLMNGAQNVERAVACYEQAAALGSAAAHACLGRLYMSKEAPGPDHKQALAHFRKALAGGVVNVLADYGVAKTAESGSDNAGMRVWAAGLRYVHPELFKLRVPGTEEESKGQESLKIDDMELAVDKAAMSSNASLMIALADNLAAAAMRKNDVEGAWAYTEVADRYGSQIAKMLKEYRKKAAPSGQYTFASMLGMPPQDVLDAENRSRDQKKALRQKHAQAMAKQKAAHGVPSKQMMKALQGIQGPAEGMEAVAAEAPKRAATSRKQRRAAARAAAKKAAKKVKEASAGGAPQQEVQTAEE
jgi:hypothetical protein